MVDSVVDAKSVPLLVATIESVLVPMEDTAMWLFDAEDEAGRANETGGSKEGDVDILETLGGVTDEATLCCVATDVMLLAVVEIWP